MKKFNACFNALNIKELRLDYSKSNLKQEITAPIDVSKLRTLTFLKFEAKDILKHKALTFNSQKLTSNSSDQENDMIVDTSSSVDNQKE